MTYAQVILITRGGIDMLIFGLLEMLEEVGEVLEEIRDGLDLLA